MLISLIVVIISQCIPILNHRVVHLKKIILYNPNIYKCCQLYLGKAGEKRILKAVSLMLE